MKRVNFNIKDRKTLSLVLCLVLVSVFTLTIAYAALNAVLTIQGSAQVSSADWDIHLANPKVTTGSATTTAPTIKTSSTMEFSTTLNMPGDFYEFTVDVVNSGSIDAMIENVIKNPELTTEQAKFLNYEVTYQNGESITTNQTLTHGTTMPIKVRVEYRRDISASDLPTTQTKLDLSLTLEYIQSDVTISGGNNNENISIYANGDINDIGTIVTIGTEQFYTIGTEGNNVKLLAMYNLYIGNIMNKNYIITPLDNPTGMQDSSAKGRYAWEAFPYIGITPYSSNTQKGINYSDYQGSIVENYVNNYKNKLEENFGIIIQSAGLITKEEIENENTFGCKRYNEEDFYLTCQDSMYPWIYSTSYWLETANSAEEVWYVYFDAVEYIYAAYEDATAGVRPVVVISKDYFK